MYKLSSLLRRFSMKPISPTFVSAYHMISNRDIVDFLQRHQIEYKESPNGFQTKYCPLCPKPHHEERSNMYTLGFKSNTGVFHCFRCGSSGSWYDFKNSLLGGTLGVETTQNSTIQYPSEEEHLQHVNNLRNEKFNEIFKYLTETRGLTPEVLESYKVGIGSRTYRDIATDQSVELPTVFFPMFFSKTKEHVFLMRIKARAIYKANKHHMKLIPTGGGWGLFGINTVSPNIKTIVLTEGEYDAMAVHQSTGLAAVSLPNGASHLPLQLMPWLEQFQKIYL